MFRLSHVPVRGSKEKLFWFILIYVVDTIFVSKSKSLKMNKIPHKLYLWLFKNTQFLFLSVSVQHFKTLHDIQT